MCTRRRVRLEGWTTLLVAALALSACAQGEGGDEEGALYTFGLKGLAESGTST